MNFARRRIAILGAGREGLATLKYLQRHGADSVSVLDANPGTPVIKGVPMLTGPHYLKNLSQYEIIFRSPGVPYLSPEIQAAKEAGVAITSHTKLFFDIAPAQIIGISGTKGKGTTANLIHDMLRAGGRKSHLGGNIGVPPLEFVDELTKDNVAVIELSSFQLQDMTVSPAVSVLTNLTKDHLNPNQSVAEYNAAKTKLLDYHQSLEEYHAAKHNLFAHQQPEDTAIFNQDDAGSRRAAKEVPHGAERWFSVQKSADASISRNNVMVSGKKVLPVGDIPVPGPHNRANVLAACLAAEAVGVGREAMAEAIRNYRGLPYRMEFIREHHGIRFFNDSYATNPIATIPALESFEEPVVLLAGGSEKGLDYEDLAEIILQRAKALVSIGPAGKRIEQAVAAAAAAKGRAVPPTRRIKDKKELLPASLVFAQSGDIILLSPAAGSFGMFENYLERGKYFTEQVTAL